MTDTKQRNQTVIKILIPIVIVWGVITIFKAGYAVGVWLHAVFH